MGSYWDAPHLRKLLLPKFESVDNLLKQLGHGSTDMLRKSYKRAVTKEEAERFWSIFPPKQEEQKIVAFPAA